MYLSERNPLDSSNIYYAVSENVDAEEIKCLLDSGDYQIRIFCHFYRQTISDYSAVPAICQY